MTNGNGKTVDQKARALRIVFRIEISNDKMPEESWDRMEPPIKAALGDACCPSA